MARNDLAHKASHAPHAAHAAGLRDRAAARLADCDRLQRQVFGGKPSDALDAKRAEMREVVAAADARLAQLSRANG